MTTLTPKPISTESDASPKRYQGNLIVRDHLEPPENGAVFIGLPPMARCLQSSLTWNEATEGCYAAALQNDVTSYFLTPKRSIFCNGLDGERTVEATIQVFPAPDAALAEIWRWARERDARALVIYQLKANGRDELCATPVLRLAVTPAKSSVGPILYQDKTLDLDVDAWARRYLAEARAKR